MQIFLNHSWIKHQKSHIILFWQNRKDKLIKMLFQRRTATKKKLPNKKLDLKSAATTIKAHSVIETPWEIFIWFCFIFFLHKLFIWEFFFYYRLCFLFNKVWIQNRPSLMWDTTDTVKALYDYDIFNVHWCINISFIVINLKCWWNVNQLETQLHFVSLYFHPYSTQSANLKWFLY